MEFTWAVVLRGDEHLEVGQSGWLVRDGYRVAPHDAVIRVLRRDDRADLGAARFSEIHVGAAAVLCARYDAVLTAQDKDALAQLGNKTASVLRYEIESLSAASR